MSPSAVQATNSSMPFNCANLEFRPRETKTFSSYITYIRFIESAEMAVQEEQIY